MDTDGSGTISLEEFDKVLSSQANLSRGTACCTRFEVFFLSSAHVVYVLPLSPPFSLSEAACTGLFLLLRLCLCPLPPLLVRSPVDLTVVAVAIFTTATADIRSLFASVDVDNTGKELNFNEFLAATLERRQLDEMRLKLAFDRLDFDHSGTIDGELPPLGDHLFCRSRPPFFSSYSTVWYGTVWYAGSIRM